MEQLQAPSVSIDGDKIRKIREAKRLTQLYVAKVVGVTTDTVSRWENNRYPTIRRDNVLKLAEALEVEIGEILRLDDEVEEEIFEAEEEPKTLPWLLLLIVGGLVAAALMVFFSKSAAPPMISAERILPHFAAPGSRVLIRIKLAAEKPLKGMILREEFPKGWVLIEANPPALSIDNQQGVARWIFRNPESDAIVSYWLQVADDAVAGEEVRFNGELIANPDGQRYAQPLDSSGTMVVRQLHWADKDGNRIIDDHEILEVSEILDQIGQLHLDWDLLEEIWDAGGYRWNPVKERFEPQRPPPPVPQEQQPPQNSPG
jgi:transcriptional regulator with XRE-family HTH domain